MSPSVETYRGFVYPWVIDHVGHMNVQSYTARFDEATWQFLGHLGVSPPSLKRQERGFAALEQRTQYKREVFCGSLVHVTTELAAVGRSTLRFVHRMFDSETGAEVAVMELVAVHIDTARRRSVALPEAMVTKANELITKTEPSQTEPIEADLVGSCEVGSSLGVGSCVVGS
jgi:acyl-CoA thioester hydrolase